MIEKIRDLLTMAEFLDGAILIVSAFLFGNFMWMLLKRKK